MTGSSNGAQEREDASPALDDFFKAARGALDALKNERASPGERAKAARIWRLIYRLVYFPQDQGEKRAQRLAVLETRAAMADLPNLQVQLAEFAQTIGHEILMSPEPAKAGNVIFGPQTRKGRKERSLLDRLATGLAIEALREEGLTLEQACEKFAAFATPRISPDAIRRIYENFKNEAGASGVASMASTRIVEAIASL
jgi:hypothetical protein